MNVSLPTKQSQMKTKGLLSIVFLIFLISFNNYAQEVTGDTIPSAVAGLRTEVDVIKRIKISGYIQAQYQVTDSAGSRGFAGGDFPTGVDKRFQLRRARLKVQYDSPLNDKGFSTSQYVFQIDATQNGLTIRHVFKIHRSLERLVLSNCRNAESSLRI